MSTDFEERLYKSLPAIYRIRDEGQKEQLRALLAVIESQFQDIEDNTKDLYMNWFIETCEEWVVPYIGDLLGVRPLHGPGSSASYSLRAYVANTLAYRRRKGTAPVLEQLSRDVTGWPARAAEFFQLLSTTQSMNHVRPGNTATLDLTNPDPLDLLEGPFQSAAHTVDVRRISTDKGKYNIPNVGLFLWRLQPYLIEDAPATRKGTGLYRFSPLGHDMPLFHLPEPETEITHIAEEFNVPVPIRRLALYFDLKDYRERYAAAAPENRPKDSRYYGPNRGITVRRNGQVISPMDVLSQNLSNWDQPPAGNVSIDVARGRLAFAAGEEPGPAEKVHVSYAYGFSADIGGGPYEREDTLANPNPDVWQGRVEKGTQLSTIQAALQAWQTDGRPRGVIQIQDNEVYGGNLQIVVPSGGSLVIEAANDRRPDLRLVNPASVSGPEDASLSLNGLLIEGAISIGGDLGLNINHCTLVPGRLLDEDGTPQFPDLDSISVQSANSRTQVTITKSMVGPIRLPANARQLTIRDSIVDAPNVGGVSQPAIAADDSGTQAGPLVHLERCTIFGLVIVQQLEMASEVIFTDPVKAVRRQSGCARFSYLPASSRTPRRFHCQPDRALVREAERLNKSVDNLTSDERDFILSRLKPAFGSTHYGDPRYAQLSQSCVVEIREGAEDGSEMGVFQQLRQPQRETNLRSALDEYLPFGLEAGFFFVT